ncbi:SRPBCC family protein [Rhodococcus sp. BP-252]|uniref:Polyketide cyclase n=1 Tax=Rhodococcoides kyotonense TaxID=398843 RepID=A0A177Y6H5_9NOCA|nr:MULTISPECIES: SRPBCC family protein [Rhodococcus]MBY6410422.1 SRPBCC family protein [Rhodococcus sp. BP-320]MBY6416304.1 SRPBCC family protein [Rhodococcus sp. BP-321]MBY6420299.1 SRPBCC family protein [Rhodococcus sp. BP-324]MBY6424978.1 SRPBCC family protein [Rhodococcus sp. BP-323]MBY6430316.1 SRPBCC family protein [Rhodococcus sp. BP-322]
MVEVRRTFVVRKPIDIVVSYLRDFAHAEHWDPGTQKCVQSTPGPIGVGTEWHNESKLFGIGTELTYRMMEDQPNRVVFQGTNKTARSVDDLSFATSGPDSTEITYIADITFNGAAKLADPLAKLAFERVGNQVVPTMTEVLEAL